MFTSEKLAEYYEKALREGVANVSIGCLEMAVAYAVYSRSYLMGKVLFADMKDSLSAEYEKDIMIGATWYFDRII